MMAIAKLGAGLHKFLCVVNPTAVNDVGDRPELQEGDHLDFGRFIYNWKSVSSPNCFVTSIELRMVGDDDVAETYR